MTDETNARSPGFDRDSPPHRASHSQPDTAALIARAEAAFAQRQFDDARELLLGAVAGDPDSAPARKYLYAACVRVARESRSRPRVYIQ